MQNAKSLFLVVFYAVIFLTTRNVIAQEVPVNYVGWYSYNGYHNFTNKNNLAIIAEGTIQRDNIIIEPLQLAYLIGLSYQLKNEDRVALGYEFQYNYPYDSASQPYDVINRRIWEQYTIRNAPRIGKGFLNHRFRLEQIWTQQKSPPDYTTTSNWKFDNVFRYQINYNLPLNDKWSANFYDEIFLNMYNLQNQNVLNQNRIYAGMVYNLDTSHLWKISAGYMFQSVWNTQETPEGRKRINNVLRISIISDLSFGKKSN